MAKDYKSLLGKSSGSSWGELAGNYFAQNNKKSNRSRNILLASLFMNAAESKMQSNVMKNLEDLEDDRTIEKAKLAAQWKKRTDIETQYKDIQDQGTLGYYADQAEKAFQAANVENSKWANLSSGAIVKAKEDWKQAWADQKSLEVTNAYKGIDTSIQTVEEFSKPYNDYYKAQKRSYASPKNISLVHNLFSKVGIGGKEKGEIDKATGNFVSTVEKERAEYDTRQIAINGYTKDQAAPFKKAALEKAKLEGMQLDDDDFNTLINQSTLGLSNSAENLSVIRAAKEQFKNDGGTLTAALGAISSKELGYDMSVNMAKRNKAVAAYESAMPKPADGTPDELQLWQDNRKKTIRTALGVTDLSEDSMLRARELYSIAFNTDPSLDQDEFVKKVLSEDIRKATGGVDVNELKAAIMKTRALDIIELYGEKDSTTLGRMELTPLTKDQLEIMSNKYKTLHTKLMAMPEIMKDGAINLDILNENITTFSKGDQSIIRGYQRDNDMAIQADIAYYAAEEVGDSILRSLSNSNPLQIP